MTAAIHQDWDSIGSQNRSWRIEHSSAPRGPSAAFFPDQNGGVYERLMSTLSVALHSMDASGRLQSVNHHWCATLGYAQHEVLGRPFTELLTPESRTKLVTLIYPSYLNTGSCRHEELHVQRRDGSLATVLLSMTAYRGDKGRLERSVCLLDDISSQKLAESASNRSDQRFHAAFAASLHGMAVVSPLGVIEYANTAFQAFLGRADIETSRPAFDECVHGEDRSRFLNDLRQLLSGETASFQVELRYITVDGKVVQGATSVALVRNEQGGTEQLVVQIVDMTERNLINSRLQRAQKMEAIGQLTGGLAHDFNNLLTIISGNLELLSGKLPDDEKISRRIEEAMEAARKGAGLTRQLLAFARQQNLEPRETLVNDLVLGMESLMARSLGENIELKITTMPGSPQASIDPSQLESAILNLAINARDAMPHGGKLTIETQAAHLDQFYTAKNPDVIPGHYVLVAVSDSGTGMAPELLEKIFQPFFTTKEQSKGSGLGLAMVYGFIKQSGGHIQVYSEVGHGTSIKMYLPRRDMQTASIQLATAPVVETKEDTFKLVPFPPIKKKARILVVEDQEAVRAVACSFLEDFGYDIIEARDGFEALSRLQEHDDVDLMFSDVVMPGGMNGFDLAQAAQSMNPALKVVHTSGYPKGAMVHQDEPRFKEGMIIMKPYRREDLHKIIGDVLAIN
jgi:PAS domain S-box-containing protein